MIKEKTLKVDKNDKCKKDSKAHGGHCLSLKW